LFGFLSNPGHKEGLSSFGAEKYSDETMKPLPAKRNPIVFHHLKQIRVLWAGMLAYTVAFAGVGHYYDWWGLDWVVRGYPEDSPERLIRQELRDEKSGFALMRRDHMGLELNTDAVRAGDDAKMRLHFDKYQEEHRQAVAEKKSNEATVYTKTPNATIVQENKEEATK